MNLTKIGSIFAPTADHINYVSNKVYAIRELSLSRKIAATIPVEFFVGQQVALEETGVPQHPDCKPEHYPQNFIRVPRCRECHQPVCLESSPSNLLPHTSSSFTTLPRTQVGLDEIHSLHCEAVPPINPRDEVQEVLRVANR